MSNYNNSTSNSGTYNITATFPSGTIAYPIQGTFSVVSLSPEFTCEHCKKKIKGLKEKYVQLEVHKPSINPQNQTIPGPWSYPTDEVKYFYFHLSCFLKNIDKIKRLIILDEML